MRFFGTVLLFLLLTLRKIDSTVNVTTAPTSKTVPLYALANFTCEAIGNVLDWTVQGNLLTDPSNQDREISVTTNNISVDVWSSVLTIRALPINDEIRVGCLVFGQGINFISKGATLAVKGITAAQNLQFVFSLNKTFWSRPSFSSEKCPISYHIYVENQHGQLLCDDITEDTSYKLYNLTVCDIYTATVIAHSGGYSSSSVTIKDEYDEDVCVIVSAEVIFNEQNNLFKIKLQIFVTGYPKLCNGTLLGTIVLNGTEIEYVQKNISLQGEQSVIINYTLSNIDPELNYDFIVDLLNHLNDSKTRNVFYFTTYHVQGLTLQYYSDNGSVLVECRFAERSTADGCHVIFTESSKGTVKSINMSKFSIEENTVYQYISLPVSGNYTVTAHDIVDGTIITNPSVVYPQVLEYILLLPSPTETSITTSNSLSEWSFSLITGNTTRTINVKSTVKPTDSVDISDLIIKTIYPIAAVLLLILIVLIIIFLCLYCNGCSNCCQGINPPQQQQGGPDQHDQDNNPVQDDDQHDQQQQPAQNEHIL